MRSDRAHRGASSLTGHQRAPAARDICVSPRATESEMTNASASALADNARGPRKGRDASHVGWSTTDSTFALVPLPPLA